MPRKTTVRIGRVDPWKSGPRIIAEIDDLNISGRTDRRTLVEGKLCSKRSARIRAAKFGFVHPHLMKVTIF